MKTTRTDNGEETMISIDGNLDANTAPDFRRVVDSVAADNRQHVTLDCSFLRLIDSTGTAALLSLLKRVRANGGSLKVSGLCDQPKAMFRLLRLDRLFEL